MCSHPPGQRADAPQYQPGVERRGHCATVDLYCAEALSNRAGFAGDNNPAHHVAMSGEVLGCGVHHEVDTEIGRGPRMYS
jgi:hypothetical protein